MADFAKPNQPLSLRGLNAMAESAKQSRQLSVAGMANDPSCGNPIITAVPGSKRWVTARITGIATAYGGAPLLDDQGNLQYTWVEEERYFDGTSPDWQAYPADAPRGSRQIGTGQYKNLAHEANGVAAIEGDHVIAWAGVQIAEDDWEHVFYAAPPVIAYGTMQPGYTTTPLSLSASNITLGAGAGEGVDFAANANAITIESPGIYLIEGGLSVTDGTTASGGPQNFVVRPGINGAASGPAIFGMWWSDITIVIPTGSNVHLPCTPGFAGFSLARKCAAGDYVSLQAQIMGLGVQALPQSGYLTVAKIG